MIFKIRSNQSGFTLIEIIATVVIVAVFCAMMITMFSDSIVKSSDAVRKTLKSSDLSNVMAKINAEYMPYPRWKKSTSYSAASPPNRVLPSGMNGRFYICTSSGTSGASEPVWHDYGETYDGGAKWMAGTWKPSTSYAAGDIVIPVNPNGHFYRCITAGASGATEPAWPLTGSSDIGDGGVQWKRLLGYLQNQIGSADAILKDNSYGKYYVIQNRFVKFVSNQLQDIGGGEPENMLQITIQSAEGGINLTALFTAKEG